MAKNKWKIIAIVFIILFVISLISVSIILSSYGEDIFYWQGSNELKDRYMIEIATRGVEYCTFVFCQKENISCEEIWELNIVKETCKEIITGISNPDLKEGIICSYQEMYQWLQENWDEIVSKNPKS